MPRLLNCYDPSRPIDEQAEEDAVVWAILNKKCDGCLYSTPCWSGKDYKRPDDTDCMKKKMQLLSEDGELVLC